MPWKVAGNHLLICRQAPDGKFEVREYNSFKNRIEMPLERCDNLKGAETALEKYSGIANAMNDFNSSRSGKGILSTRCLRLEMYVPEKAGPLFSGMTPSGKRLRWGGKPRP